MNFTSKISEQNFKLNLKTLKISDYFPLLQLLFHFRYMSYRFLHSHTLSIPNFEIHRKIHGYCFKKVKMATLLKTGTRPLKINSVASF